MALRLRQIFYSLAFFCLFLVIYYRVWFLRQPARNTPTDNHYFVSPANGEVVSITHWNSDTVSVPKELFGLIHVWTKDVDTAGTMISIQMNVTNVHYQRAPVGGSVLSKKYVEGSFHNAIRMSNDLGIRFENEHNELLMETATGYRYKVVQIAGFLARRIEDYVEPGEQVKQGGVIGLIKLGSQVTLILPHGVKTTCRVGEVVIDGETVIGEIP